MTDPDQDPLDNNDHDIQYEVEDEAQFWQEIDDIVNPPSNSPEAVSNTINNFITFVSQFGAEYLPNDVDVELCCARLLDSKFHDDNAEQVREAMIAYKPELDKIAKCYINLYLLLLDGRHNARTFKLMKRAEMIPAVAKLAKDHYTDSMRLTRLALTCLYEMSRIQKLSETDLRCFDEEYIWFLLRSVEMARDDEDPYSYRSIKLIISLNEQFMVAALPHSQQPFHKSASATSLQIESEQPITNPQPQNGIVKILSDHGSRFKSFGENLIRMLNRERDTALQLLILKQLFLLFNNSATYEYIYTNDLHVLVDVFIRELYDLPDEDEALRHTYLRVLHPLLTHTQLRHAPYKGAELVALLNSLNQECSHFGPVGATTVRLLARCLTVPWLLPPRKRKLRLPRPSMPEYRKSHREPAPESPVSSNDTASIVSVRSLDSVNSIAKVRPPTKPRVKGPVKDNCGFLAPLKEGAPLQKSTIDKHKEAVSASSKTGEVAIEKHDDLLREINKLQIEAT